MEQIIVRGQITGTSNKQQEGATGAPRKSIYFKPADEQNRAKLLAEGGLREYESKDGEKFFIFKCSEKLTIWLNKEDSEVLPSSVNDPNFKTDKDIEVALIEGKSEKFNTKYVRAFALRVDSLDDIKKVEKQNPFAQTDDLPFDL